MLTVAIGHSLVVRLNNVERIEEKTICLQCFFALESIFNR